MLITPFNFLPDDSARSFCCSEGDHSGFTRLGILRSLFIPIVSAIRIGEPLGSLSATLFFPCRSQRWFKVPASRCRYLFADRHQRTGGRA